MKILVIPALLLGACSSGNDPSQNVQGENMEMASADDHVQNDMAGGDPSMTIITDAAGYIAAAGASDMWEIETAKEIEEKTKDADIKAFSKMLIDHHNQSAAKVKAAAKQAGLAILPPTLNVDQQRMLNEIKQANSASVDAIFLAHQDMAHVAALTLHQNFSAHGDEQNLRNAATQIVPIIEQHLAEVRRIAAQ